MSNDAPDISGLALLPVISGPAGLRLGLRLPIDEERVGGRAEFSGPPGTL